MFNRLVMACRRAFVSVTRALRKPKQTLASCISIKGVDRYVAGVQGDGVAPGLFRFRARVILGLMEQCLVCVSPLDSKTSVQQ